MDKKIHDLIRDFEEITLRAADVDPNAEPVEARLILEEQAKARHAIHAAFDALQCEVAAEGRRADEYKPRVEPENCRDCGKVMRMADLGFYHKDYALCVACAVNRKDV